LRHNSELNQLCTAAKTVNVCCPGFVTAQRPGVRNLK